MAYSKKKKRIYQNGGGEIQDLPEMTARAYDTARELVQSGKMDTNVFDNLYRRYNWAKYDSAVRKNTPEEQAELEQIWYGGYNPVDIANKVPATLLAGAAGPFAIGAATPAVSTALANPWVQAGLTAYGGYDATTNTIPSAYKALQEGRYWDAAGNTVLTGLNLAPIPAFGPSALRKGISKQKNLRLDKITKEQEEWRRLYDIVKASKTPKKNPTLKKPSFPISSLDRLKKDPTYYKYLDNPYNPLLKDDIPSILKTSKNPSVDPFDKILNTKEASPELLETMKKFLEGSNKGSLDDFKYGGKKKNIHRIDSNMDYLNPERTPTYSNPTFAQTYKPYLGYGYQYQYGGDMYTDPYYSPYRVDYSQYDQYSTLNNPWAVDTNVGLNDDMYSNAGWNSPIFSDEQLIEDSRNTPQTSNQNNVASNISKGVQTAGAVMGTVDALGEVETSRETFDAVESGLEGVPVVGEFTQAGGFLTDTMGDIAASTAKNPEDAEKYRIVAETFTDPTAAITYHIDDAAATKEREEDTRDIFKARGVAKYGGNMFNNYAGGGNMFNNDGFGVNTMNQIPVNEFKAGGTHEENPLGGIPQGIGANGLPNLVEQGEVKIPDPRDPSGNSSFIVSAQPDMKITKAIAEENGLSKNYVGKTVRKAADMLLRKSDLFAREGDTIKQNSINQDLIAFINAHEQLTAMKESKENVKFQEKLGDLAEEFPQQMDAMMQPPQEAMPQQGMPMGIPPMGMPMAKYGGNIHQYNPNMLNTSPDFADTPEGQYMQESLDISNIPVDNFLENNPNVYINPGTFSKEDVERFEDNPENMLAGASSFNITPDLNNPYNLENYNAYDQFKLPANSIEADDNMEYNNYGLTPNMTNPWLHDYGYDPLKVALESNKNLKQIVDKGNKNKSKEEQKLEKEIEVLKEKARNFKETGKDVDKKVETVKEINRKQSALSAMMQMAPIAMNLGMGLFGKKDKLELSRMSPTELRRIDAQERIKGLGYDLAGAREKLRGAAGGQGGTYLGNMQSLFNRGAEARGKIYSDVERQNIGIDAREKAMNQRADQINLSQQAREKMYEKQAQAAQQNMLNTGFQQLAQYFAAQDANRLGADYAGMYSDTYDYTWEPFMEGLFSKKDKKDKKNKK